jgi:hypothetical protein
MAMSDPRIPVVLRERVEQDLSPVRPLASPERRTLVLVPLGVLLLVGVPLAWGWRENFGLLVSSRWGPAMAWGLSAVQTLTGLLVVSAGLREAVPGRTLPASRIAAIIGLAIVVVTGVTWMTDLVAPAVSPPGTWARFAWECTGTAVVSALPGLAIVAWLASRALPPRPAVAGAIYGLGAGLLADSGVRLFCWVSEPSHVLVSHGGAILIMMALGVIASVTVERIRAVRRRSRR